MKTYSPKNCLTHFHSAAIKARKSENIIKMREVRAQAADYMDVSACIFCIYDDFGHCSLTHANVSEDEVFINCFDAWIKQLETDINENNFNSLYQH